MINEKIRMLLGTFEKMNERLTKDKNYMAELFEELRVGIIKVLNEIAGFYVFRDPDKAPYEGKRR